MSRQELEKKRDELNLRIADLDDQLQAVLVSLLSLDAIVPIGGIIEWKKGKTYLRGRVAAYEDWVGHVAYEVISIRKDGSPGSSTRVYPYHKPVAITE